MGRSVTLTHGDLLRPALGPGAAAHRAGSVTDARRAMTPMKASGAERARPQRSPVQAQGEGPNAVCRHQAPSLRATSQRASRSRPQRRWSPRAPCTASDISIVGPPCATMRWRCSQAQRCPVPPRWLSCFGLGLDRRPSNGLSQSTIRARRGAQVEVRRRGAIAQTGSGSLRGDGPERARRTHRLWTAVVRLSLASPWDCRSLLEWARLYAACAFV